jgi:small-conductance mechanosensitive channel
MPSLMIHSELSPAQAAQSPRGIARAAIAVTVIVGFVLLAAIVFVSLSLGGKVGDRLTRNLIRLSFAWYVVAVCGMTRLRPSDWPARSALGRWVRWCWTWAAICYLAHVAAAFHFFYHWSDHAAYEQTRQTSGIGEGLYVSYLFTAIWAADVLWWWLTPAAYAARSKWITRGVHAFMAFIIFNGIVVYVTGVIRIGGITGFALILAYWVVAVRRKAVEAPQGASMAG